MIGEDGQDFELASWDWDFYSEKLRAKLFNFDANDLSFYFELNNVLQKGVFYAAESLFGVTFQGESICTHPEYCLLYTSDAADE